MFTPATEKRTYKWKHCSWNLILEVLCLLRHFAFILFSSRFFTTSHSLPPLLLPPLLFHVLYWIDNYPRTKASHLHRFCQPFWYTVSQRLWLKPLSLLWQIEENSFRITNFPKSKTGALTSTPKATPRYWEHDFRCQEEASVIIVMSMVRKQIEIWYLQPYFSECWKKSVPRKHILSWCEVLLLVQHNTPKWGRNFVQE